MPASVDRPTNETKVVDAKEVAIVVYPFFAVFVLVGAVPPETEPVLAMLVFAVLTRLGLAVGYSTLINSATMVS